MCRKEKAVGKGGRVVAVDNPGLAFKYGSEPFYKLRPLYVVAVFIPIEVVEWVSGMPVRAASSREKVLFPAPGEPTTSIRATVSPSFHQNYTTYMAGCQILYLPLVFLFFVC